jgi:hypothetical protein
MENRKILLKNGVAPKVSWWLTMLVLSGLALCVGCGDSESAKAQDDGQLPEAIAVRRAFESSAASHRNPINEVLALIKAGALNRSAYSEALPQLETLVSNPTFSADQKKALTDLIQKLRSELAAPGAKAKSH